MSAVPFVGLSIMEVRRVGPQTPEQFRSEVLSSDEPLVVSGMLGEWRALSWAPSSFSAAHTYGGDATAHATFRRRDAAGPAWETDCTHHDVSLGAFARWAVGDGTTKEGWEEEVDPATHWGYVSYARMAELFSQHPDMMQADMLDWRAVGLEESFGWDTNFWFGTSGAITQLHYDTYVVPFEPFVTNNNLSVQNEAPYENILLKPSHASHEKHRFENSFCDNFGAFR